MSETDKIDKKNNYLFGHRRRVKEKFLKAQSTSHFSDYELLELLLFYAIPRKDVKNLAKHFLQEFGSVENLIYTSESNFISLKGSSRSTYVLFIVIREMIARIFENRIKNKNILSSWSALIDYLKVTLGHKNTEEFRVIFLNKKNVLIADEIHTHGTIDQSSVYPREIVKRSLFHEATAIILVHNHPSGDTEPSRSDLEITKKIISVCSNVNVTVHDHIIVSKNGFFSFKSKALI